MKRPAFSEVILGFFFFLLSFSSLYSQSGWFDLNVSYNIRCLNFVSDQTGWAAGNGGIILRTTNGGVNWILQHSDTPYTMSSVHFPNSQTGYVVGFRGGCCYLSPVYKTTNGGSNWTLQDCNTTYILSSVYFVSASEGWIVGDSSTILHTTNGGNNWLHVPSIGYEYYTCVQFMNSSTGWVVGKNKIIKTTNGGVNWIYPPPSPIYSEFWEARFPSAATGYVVGGDLATGSGFVLKSTNGGESWDSLSVTSSGYLLYLSFVNVSTGWVCGFDGVIMHTTDGGTSWERQTIGQPSAWLQCIQFVNSATGWVTGSPSIFKTITGGVIGIIPISGQVPKVYSLSQNYPNPFNPATTIRFSLPLPSPANGGINSGGAQAVRITIFNLLGERIATIVNEPLKSGTYEVTWDATSFSSGTYFYRLQAGEFVDAKKMILIK
jgi:photosystem II stability/assembly factor-like uncharacterized protein